MEKTVTGHTEYLDEMSKIMFWPSAHPHCNNSVSL
jgi:hypothetical protein